LVIDKKEKLGKIIFNKIIITTQSYLSEIKKKFKKNEKLYFMVDEVHLFSDFEYFNSINCFFLGISGSILKNVDNFKNLIFFFNKNFTINCKILDYSLSVTSLNIKKNQILEESKKIRDEMKKYSFIMQENLDPKKFDILYVFLNSEKNKKIQLYNIKDSYKISKKEINLLTPYENSKLLSIIRIIDLLGEGVIIQNQYTKILDKLELILKEQLEKKYNIKKFYGNLSSKRRNEIIEIH
jgi:superfamily II DNA or RNA helicase